MKALIKFILAWIICSWIAVFCAGIPAYLLTYFPYELFVHGFFGDWVYNPYVWEARVEMAFLILWAISSVFGIFISCLVLRDKL